MGLSGIRITDFLTGMSAYPDENARKRSAMLWFLAFSPGKSGIRCENTRYVRLETDFRSKETRHVFFFDTSYKMVILVEDTMLMVN